MQLRSFAFLAALALAGGCKSDDGGASNGPQQPSASAAPAPPAEESGDEVGPGGGSGGRGGRQRMTPEERRAERMKQFDANGDGRLDRDERLAMRRDNLDRRMKRMDSDGDGKISRQEAAGGRIGQRLLADFDRADVNRDSFISRDELERAADELRARRRAERQQQQTGAGASPAQPPPAGGMNDDDGSDALDDED